MTKTQRTAELRKTRIAESFKAWGIGLVSVTQTMPKTAPKWFRCNIADHREIETAKAVADAIETQYGIHVAVVAW